MSWKTLSRNSVAAFVLVAAAGAALAQADSIEVESLRPVDPISVGILTQSQGGLPGAMWQGTNAELAAEAMARAPTQSWSPSVNRLLARTLLSGGDAPAGGDGEALSLQRMQVLMQAPFAAEAAQLSARTPDIAARPDLAEAEATAELITGDLAAACATGDALQEGRDGPFWLRLRAVCLAAGGESARADITAQLAQEAGESAQFDRAYALALLGDAPEELVETADPLVFAAAVRAGAMITVADAGPRSMIAPGEDPERAVLLAEQAAVAGYGADEAVTAAYEAVDAATYGPAAVADGEAGALAEAGPAAIVMGQDRFDIALDAPTGARSALLYQLANDPAEAAGVRAQAMAAFLESELSAEGFMLASRVMLPALRSLPDDAGQNDALLFAKAAAVAGDAALARDWLRLAVDPPVIAATVDPVTGAPVPLDAAEPWTPPSDADLAAAEALIALHVEGPEAAVERLESEGDPALLFTDAVVLDALGKSAEPELRLRLLRGEAGSGARADPDVLLAMESAAQAGATAETALLAAAAMGEGPGRLAPADLGRVLRALVAAGLEDAAREAGLEAMLAHRR